MNRVLAGMAFGCLCISMPLGISIAQPTPRVQQLRAHTGDADRAMAKAAQARTKREDYREALIRLTGIDPDSV